MLPAAGGFNRRASPHSGGAVEIKESTAARASAVLDHEMSVQQNGFYACQQGIVGVQVRPACLHHTDILPAARTEKVRDRAAQKIVGWQKIRVEDGDELPLCALQAILECTGLVTLAIRAVDIDDGQAFCGVTLDARLRDLLGLVGRIVEYLNIEQ